MSTSITLAIAAVICTFIYRLSKWYVDNYCQDNPEIIWIWLDDDDTVKGHPVRIKTRRGIKAGHYRLSTASTSLIKAL